MSEVVGGSAAPKTPAPDPGREAREASFAARRERLQRVVRLIFDGEEIQLKRTNEFTEHYKIDYSNAYVRTGPGTLRGTCYPAAF